MFCSIISSSIYGVEAVPVHVEVDVSDGMPVFIMVGSVSSSVKESQDRVRTALKNLGIGLPPKRITLNLAPGDIKKSGARFDLPIAACVLTVLGRIPSGFLTDHMVLGELHLDGRCEGIPGVLPSVIRAKKMGLKACIVPAGNYLEAANVDGIKIIGVRTLNEMIDYCGGREPSPPPSSEGVCADPHSGHIPDFSDILGQPAVKRAALISAAGFHNLLLSGPPGSGKSMTAVRIPGILPEMTRGEQLEVSGIYSVAGLLNSRQPLIRRRPFRSPHNSLSVQALCGGGANPRPGEITLAHRGVLFIDELSEMPGRNLDHLRGPLEDRHIRISRISGSVDFPANFLFVAATNPCPCGYFPDADRCSCTPSEILSYQRRISQPILDRIDLRTDVPPLEFDALNSGKSDSITSELLRSSVTEAFALQAERYKKIRTCFNSELSPPEIKIFCRTTDEATRLLSAAYSRMGLTARAYHKILKVSRTIADLEKSDPITEAHVSEALCFRQNTEHKL